jgi:hypothetical protein
MTMYLPLPIKQINNDYKIKWRFWKNIITTDNTSDCWLWIKSPLYNKQDNRPKFRIGSNTYFAARIAYYLCYKIDPDQLQVCHNCPGSDNPLCMNACHMWLGTLLENQRDSRNKGRIYTGRIKYSDDIVLELRYYYDNKIYRIFELAKIYNMPFNSVLNIVKRNNRQNLP